MRAHKSMGAVLVAGGLAAALGAGALLFQELRSGRPLHSLVVLIGLGLAALVLTTVGIYQALAPAAEAPSEVPVKASYRHTFRLFALTALFLVTAGVAREFAVPDSYGQFGFYRGAAVAEARAKTPVHQGQARCASCHAKKSALHDKDAHARVQCETCHGPGLAHASRPSTKIGAPKGQRTCLTCHLRLDARPSAFAQIEVAEHYRLVGVKRADTPCTTCHDPHEPLFMDRDLRTARLHPVVHRCRDCHKGSARDERTPRPAGHPPIFECRSCHGPVVADFATRSHKEVRCATCHLFFKESEYAGRILRDADPRFCLLCHRGGAFRAEKAPPSIEWPKHREEMGSAPEDANKRCIDCHREKIHRPHKEEKKDAP